MKNFIIDILDDHFTEDMAKQVTQVRIYCNI